MYIMTPLLSFSLIITVLLRYGASEYDPMNRIYPWPIPADRKAIFFSLIVSFSETFNSSGVVPGVNVALDIINSNDSNLLSGYSLHYILSDSQCSRTRALDVFFQQILSETQYHKLAVIGAGCSLATEPTAEVSHQFNITQLSCVSTSPTLSDRRRFKKYFQLLPSMVDLAHGYVGMFKYYGWSRIILIVQEENLFLEMIRSLKKLLTHKMITYTEYTFSTNIGLSDIKVEPFTIPDQRIYVIATYENYARALLCRAFHQNVRYPTHLLLTFQWYNERWWLKKNDLSDVNLTCSAEERESVLLHSLAFNFVVSVSDLLKEKNDIVMSDIGITRYEYVEKERHHLGKAPHYFRWSPYAQYCFDATLTLAYALNETITATSDSEINSKLASSYEVSDGTFTLDNFNYKSDALTNITFLHIENMSFNGITGEVTFNKNGIRPSKRLSVYQFRTVDTSAVNWVKISTLIIRDGTNDYVIDNQSELSPSTVWPDGVPFDGIPTMRMETVSIILAVVVYTLVAAGVVFAMVCLIFNFIFRNKKLIRLSSPKLNNITVCGVISLYLSAVLFAIPTCNKLVVEGLCIARLWFLYLGVSLAFGTIIMKMFRIYVIYSNPSPKSKKLIWDWMLAVGVLIMVIIDLVALIVYTASVLSLDLEIVEQTLHKENPRIVEGRVRNITENTIYVCQSTPEKAVVGVLSTYKGLLQLLAFFLAICIPRVKVKGLNDTKYIIVAVYVSSLALSLVTVAHFTMTDYINTHTALFSVATCFSGAAILGLLFIPKMISLYKDPKGEKVFSDVHTSNALQSVGTGIPGSPLSPKLPQKGTFSTEDTLRTRIKELEHVLYTYQSNEGVLTSSNDIQLDEKQNATKWRHPDNKRRMPSVGKEMTVVTV